MDQLKLLFSYKNENQKLDDLALFVLRVFVGLTMAFAHGLDKLPPSETLLGAVSSMGFPAPVFFAWCAALAEFLGGILIALGLLTRPAALSLAFTMGVAGFVIHGADPFVQKEKALLFFVVSLFFVIKGAGQWSLDQLILNRK